MTLGEPTAQEIMATINQFRADLRLRDFADRVLDAAAAAAAQGVGVVVDYDSLTAEPNRYVPPGTMYLISLEGALRLPAPKGDDHA